MRTSGPAIAAAVAILSLSAAEACAEPARAEDMRLAQAGPAVQTPSEAEKRAKEQRQREQEKRQQGGAQQRPPEPRSGPPQGGPPRGEPRSAQPPPPRQPPPQVAPPPRRAEPPPPPAVRKAEPPPAVQRRLPEADRGPSRPASNTPPPSRDVAPPRERSRQPEFRDRSPGEPPRREPAAAEPRIRETPRTPDTVRGGPPAVTQPATGLPPAPLPKVTQPDRGKGPPPATGRGPVSPPPAIIAAPPTAPPRVVAPGAPAPRFDELKAGRKERREAGGARTIIQEPGPGGRTIIRQNNRVLIHHDETARFRRLHANAETRRRPDGYTETFYVRPDGVRVVTVTDRNGRLVQRYRRDVSGREHSIIDNRRFFRNAAIAAGIGAVAVAVALSLPPPRVAIARERYIVDYGRASDDDLYEALSAPPIEPLERVYSLEEVRYSYPLRQRMRRVDLDTINFEFGSWQVGEEQYAKLERIARIMRRMLERNPGEVFLVGAHTDAVGSSEDNLSLSDRRAETVAAILSEQFGVPPENLVTQGYGEQHLKVESSGPEERNRRVEFQRITPLITQQ